jgi:hypothetical protein
MPITINVNNLSLVHKQSSGFSTATLPDVCKTPSPGGPVPLPYPNLALATDLAKGTTTVTADGGNMCANYGSEFSRSTGDEPGSCGGVKSGVFMREATWITYSLDVKLEGKGACRLSDKMFHNMQNTVNAAGAINPPLFQPPSDPKCASIYDVIFRLIWGERPEMPPGGGFPQGTKGLAARWKEMAENKGGWSAAENSTHMDEYDKLQTKLKKKLEEWRNKKKRNCNDDDLPPGAQEYSEQVPQLGPEKPLIPEPVTKAFKEFAKAMGDAAVKWGPWLTALYILSRIIRAIPPLTPTELSPI